MPLYTAGVVAAVTPTVVKTYVSHYTNRKPRRKKPTAHITYDEGLHLIRAFLDYASHHTVESLQAFTAQSVPHPRWVKVDNVAIGAEYLAKAADTLIQHLKKTDPEGTSRVGGTKWWQWRGPEGPLECEWIEMRADWNARRRQNEKPRRVMLYIHGGAYFFGSVDEHRYQIQRHARKLRARALAPRYRLAPQFPFPGGLQDCLAAYLYLLTVQDPTEIIIAGDSAGGGMALAILVILRDHGIPLPAGAVLISPWVDLTHSMPSVSGHSDLDYIPPHGFMHKPSAAWPPPDQDELDSLARNGISKTLGARLDLGIRKASTVPGRGRQLSIALDGKSVTLKDQIQMYATNEQLAHPLVSPMLQPSLGGLPPMLILTGGGEILRDEQILLAHRASDPARYPLGAAHADEFDPRRQIQQKHRATDVQLQIWENACHVLPTLSFTRPAKLSYRSIAQFGAWALARAQKTSIEIPDDDDVSVTSSGSENDEDSRNSSVDLAKPMERDRNNTSKTCQVGQAGSPLPPFRNHMIRQRVDRHGVITALEAAQELEALQVPPADIGAIKPGPVRKFLAAKQHWDKKYAREKRRLQHQRLNELAMGASEGFGPGEYPPPSALAGRRTKRDERPKKDRKDRLSLGLMMWSSWNWKHDQEAVKKEDALEKTEEGDADEKDDIMGKERFSLAKSRSRSNSTSRKSTGKDAEAQAGQSRGGTVSVRDEGQADFPTREDHLPHKAAKNALLSPPQSDLPTNVLLTTCPPSPTSRDPISA